MRRTARIQAGSDRATFTWSALWPGLTPRRCSPASAPSGFAACIGLRDLTVTGRFTYHIQTNLFLNVDKVRLRTILATYSRQGGHIKPVSITVRADWDEEARVWVATSDDIDGLAIEAENLEALKEQVVAAVCDLVELNGFSGDGTLPEIPIHIISDQLTRIPNPCY